MKLAALDRKVSEALQKIAALLDSEIEKAAGQKMGFSLVIFNAEAGSRMNYISNCNRDEVANALTSLLVGWGKGMPDIAAHEINS